MNQFTRPISVGVGASPPLPHKSTYKNPRPPVSLFLSLPTTQRKMSSQTSNNSGNTQMPPYGTWLAQTSAPTTGAHALPVDDPVSYRPDGYIEPRADGYIESRPDGYIEPSADDYIEPRTEGYTEPPLNTKQGHYAAYHVSLVTALANRDLLGHMMPAVFGPADPEMLRYAVADLMRVAFTYYPDLPWEAVRPAPGADFAAHTATVDAWVAETPDWE